MATSAISFISGMCYTRNIYAEKEKIAAATNRAKAEEIAKK